MDNSFWMVTPSGFSMSSDKATGYNHASRFFPSATLKGKLPSAEGFRMTRGTTDAKSSLTTHAE